MVARMMIRLIDEVMTKEEEKCSELSRVFKARFAK